MSLPVTTATDLFDDGGCLSLDALCFIDELSSDHRDVVGDHAASCPTCSQQRTMLTAAAEHVRARRPQLYLPADARIIARRAALRGARHRAPHVPSVPVAAPWWSSPRLWVTALALVTAAACIVAGLLL